MNATIRAHTLPTPSARSTNAKREDWLNKFMEAARITYAEHGLTIPDRIRIGVGLIGKGVLGCAWIKEVTNDGAVEITIAPTVDATVKIAGTLAHELIHACGIRGHRKDFADAGRSLGLVGKPTCMGFDGLDRAPDWADRIIAELGAYPSGTLNPYGEIIPFPGGPAGRPIGPTGKPRQTTRMHKASCDACDMVFRVSRKHADRITRCPDATCSGAVTVAV